MKTINQVGVDKNIVLTEKIGEELLSHRENERTATNRHIDAIARCIEKCGWIGSKIYISSSKELLDGQNRLLALKKLGWPSITINARVFRDEEITPELRSSFNKYRPQSLRDTMKMSFGWSVNASRRVPVYKFIARLCLGEKAPVDEYTMIVMDESFPAHLDKLISCRSKNEVASDIKGAFVLAGLVNVDKSEKLLDDVCKMIFPTCKCHARRIHDYIKCLRDLSGNKKGHGGSFIHPKRILYAIDKYINGFACPIIGNVDDKKVDDVANYYIGMMKRTVRFA